MFLCVVLLCFPFHKYQLVMDSISQLQRHDFVPGINYNNTGQVLEGTADHNL